MRLVVLHHPPGARPVSDGPLWRTCLRAIEFVDELAPPSWPAERTLCDAPAYRFLLEVICGLRSPLPGETQVHGQFKAFADRLDPVVHAPTHRLSQQLLADAKAVRERHLRSLGSRTYGTAVRRWVLDCDRAALIGSGALASELRPYLAAGRRLDVWSRRRPEDGPAGDDGSWRPLEDASSAGPLPGRAAVVVAAPAATAAIEAIAACYPALQRVVDLRGDAERTGLDAGVPVVTLDDVFSASAGSAERASDRIETARREIAARAHAWFARAELHPHGWEDVCA